MVSAATKAHPAFKYAIVIAGIAALVAIVLKFGVTPPALIFGVLIGLFFMFVFLIFSIATRAKDQQFGSVVFVVVWALAILFIVLLSLLLISAFFDKPIKLRTYLENVITTPPPSDEEFEERVRKVVAASGGKTDPAQIKREVELRKEEPNRFRRNEIYWPNRATIRVGFLDGTKAQQDRVLSVAREWTKYANVNFASAAPGDADVRVSFKTEGEWSFMGTQCLAVPKDEPTTSLGPPVDFQDEKQSRHFILHAFGHVLGLIHEFQIPAAKQAIDLEEAYRYFAGPPHFWSKEHVDTNLAPLKEGDPAYADATFDPHSVMLADLPDEIKIVMWSGYGGSELSSGDISLIRKIYPGR